MEIVQGNVKTERAQPVESKVESTCEGGFVPYHESVPASLVVFWTTLEGTVAALKTARALAKTMGTQITLILTEAVPPQFSLETPMVPIEFLENQTLAAVFASGALPEDIRIQIWLCRDPEQCLQQILRPCSLVILGGRPRGWLREEKKMRKRLTRLGHQVILVEAGQIHPLQMLPQIHRESIICWQVKPPRPLLRSELRSYPGGAAGLS